MTEEEAQRWIDGHFGESRLETMTQLVAIVTAEATQQNLIAPSTVPVMWTRHVVDSAQLLHQAEVDGVWVDIGSGAGFPGLVVAGLSNRTVWLIEPRRKRAEFLQHAANVLGMADRVHVVCDSARAVTQGAAIISARAVAPLVELFELGRGCASSATRWILPKGRSARDEIAIASKTWHGVFHVEQSITDPKSLIVLASKVSRR